MEFKANVLALYTDRFHSPRPHTVCWHLKDHATLPFCKYLSILYLKSAGNVRLVQQKTGKVVECWKTPDRNISQAKRFIGNIWLCHPFKSTLTSFLLAFLLLFLFSLLPVYCTAYERKAFKWPSCSQVKMWRCSELCGQIVHFSFCGNLRRLVSNGKKKH